MKSPIERIAEAAENRCKEKTWVTQDLARAVAVEVLKEAIGAFDPADYYDERSIKILHEVAATLGIEAKDLEGSK